MILFTEDKATILIAEVHTCVSPLWYFKISIAISFFWREKSQFHGSKLARNVLLTEKTNQEGFQEIMSASLPKKNKVWKEDYDVANGGTWIQRSSI